jgi:hypothetical protein
LLIGESDLIRICHPLVMRAKVGKLGPDSVRGRRDIDD